MLCSHKMSLILKKNPLAISCVVKDNEVFYPTNILKTISPRQCNKTVSNPLPASTGAATTKATATKATKAAATTKGPRSGGEITP